MSAVRITSNNDIARTTSIEHMQLVAYVSGRVHGVGFRYFVRTAAKRLGVTGWVRNERNGTLCVVAEGPTNRLHHLVRALRTGPSLSSVDGVQCEWQEPTGTFNEFSIRS